VDHLEDPSSERVAERRPVAQREVMRCSPTPAASEQDAIAVEEPLEIRVASDTLVTLMRTPGEDHYLTAGFLFSEGIIADIADVGTFAHCGRPSDPAYGNSIDVAPGPGIALAPERVAAAQRSVLSTSACGVCGRDRIDDMLARMRPLVDARRLDVRLVHASLDNLRERQGAFSRTGAMHGALACDARGLPLAWSEDVGRHNAVDKVVGKLLYAGALRAAERPFLLAVSGRSSFEIVQKAAIAGLACVVSVSAPTSLAIDLAHALGLTLVGFARGQAFNAYTHPERLYFGD
jgi:FdhD protein